MKTILKYLEYLIKKPMKLLWLIGLNAFVQFAGFYIFSGELYAENVNLVMWALGIFVTAIFVVVNLQPYIEWRDGLDRTEK